MAAVYIVSNSQALDEGTMYYVCKDNLGSITHLLDDNCALQEEMAYDAWGRRRKPYKWCDYNISSTHIIDRGFTGHEHLDLFGIINMNGRVYDPIVGRFLSPDPFVQAPDFTQSFNRYSYAMNSPLMYSDPSGYTYMPGIGHCYTTDLGEVLENALELTREMSDRARSKLLAEQDWRNFMQSGLLRSAIWGTYIQTGGSSPNACAFNNASSDDDNEGDKTQSDAGFDIDKAVDYLNSNAHNSSQGACSRYVQKALVEGGINAGTVYYAGGSYGTRLEKWGFTMISTTTDNYTPMKGDIAVIQGYSGGTQCREGPCGHIQMYNGNQWVSDFFQTRPFWPGQKYEDYKPSFEIYRWK